MTDNDQNDGRFDRHRRGWPDSSRTTERDGIGRQLDAALAKYTAVEPRAGLEERILANLRAQKEASVAHPWWRWAAVGAVALFVLVGGMALRKRTERPGLVNVPDHTERQNRNIQTAHAPIRPLLRAEPATSAEPAMKLRAVKVKASHEPVVARAPHMSEFPSPEPLSEQEKMLAAYVAQHRQQAVLIAQARMAELKEDLVKEREMESEGSTPDHPSSDQSITR